MTMPRVLPRTAAVERQQRWFGQCVAAAHRAADLERDMNTRFMSASARWNPQHVHFTESATNILRAYTPMHTAAEAVLRAVENQGKVQS
jgi:hypothetical protein